MVTFGKQQVESFEWGNKQRVSSAPEGIRHMTVDWETVEGDAGDRCIELGTVMIPIKVENKSTGLVGPYDANAADGRQVLERSNAFILNETACEKDQGSQPVEIFESGKVYKALLRVGGERQPTWEEFDAAFTQLTPLSD